MNPFKTPPILSQEGSKSHLEGSVPKTSTKTTPSIPIFQPIRTINLIVHKTFVFGTFVEYPICVA
jgi:hypothetical protein